MKKILFYLFLSFGILGFQIQTNEECAFNLKVNDNWEEKMTEKSFPFHFIEMKNVETTNIFHFTTSNDSKEIELTLEERTFLTPCAAYQNFKDAFFYFHTKWPKFEKSTHPCIYLIQNNKLFVVSTQPGQEKVMETFVESFLPIFLVDSYQEGSLFVRYTSAKAVLK